MLFGNSRRADSTFSCVYKAAVALTLSIFFLAQQNISAQSLWSDPTTWPGGVVPQADFNVVIPAGQHVILDINPPALAGLQIQGKLSFAEVPLHLTADWILVNGGVLEIGTESAPHINDARITLRGADEDVMGMDLGGKFLGVMPGGKVDLHGLRGQDRPWTMLNGTVVTGTDQLTTAHLTNWRVGDEIVIAPSGVQPDEAEVVTITGISGKNVQFSPVLQYDHYGATQSVDGKLLDMRAEIGLLTRNIIIEGDAASDINQFGGHFMVMMGGDAYVEGVEFRRMGQLGRQGKYPCHWHLSGDQYDNYARRNAVRDSYHRAFVIHGTNGVQLDGNVAYNINSHAFVVAEDGDEQFNIVQNNLGVLIKKLRTDQFAFPDDGIVGGSSQSEHRPGVFWMKNPNQIFLNNRAAGSYDGIGFFFDGPGTATDIPEGFFKGNLAHSNYSYFPPEVNDRYPQRTRGHGLFIRFDEINGETYDFESFTSYKNSLSGVWMEEYGQQLRNSVLADNGTGVIVMRGEVRNTSIVHQTANSISHPVKDYGAINILEGFGKKKDFILDSISVVGFPTAAIRYEDSIIGPALQVTNFSSTSSSGPQVEFTGARVQGAVRDLDGSLYGMGNSLVFHDTYPFGTPGCVTDPTTGNLICDAQDYHFLTLKSENGASRAIGDVVVYGMGLGSDPMYSYEEPAQHTRYHHLPKNNRYYVQFQDLAMIPNFFQMELKGEADGYTAIRMDFSPGFVGYLIDEFDEVVNPVASLGDLRFDQTNYYVDPANSRAYIIMKLDAANNFEEKLSILQVPSILIREGQTIEPQDIQAAVNPTIVRSNALLQYTLPVQSETIIEVFDLTGKRVYQHHAGMQINGAHTLNIPTSGWNAGSYIYRISTANGPETTGRFLVAE